MPNGGPEQLIKRINRRQKNGRLRVELLFIEVITRAHRAQALPVDPFIVDLTKFASTRIDQIASAARTMQMNEAEVCRTCKAKGSPWTVSISAARSISATRSISDTRLRLAALLTLSVSTPILLN